jgi:hypothetical protein
LLLVAALVLLGVSLFAWPESVMSPNKSSSSTATSRGKQACFAKLLQITLEAAACVNLWSFEAVRIIPTPPKRRWRIVCTWSPPKSLCSSVDWIEKNVPLKGRGGYNHQPQKAELIERERGGGERGGEESGEPEGMRVPEQSSSRTYWDWLCKILCRKSNSED